MEGEKRKWMDLVKTKSLFFIASLKQNFDLLLNQKLAKTRSKLDKMQQYIRVIRRSQKFIEKSYKSRLNFHK